MDFLGAILLFIFLFVLFSCCGYCCTKKRRGAVLSAPVIVTSATHTAPGGYPVPQMAVESTTTTTYQTQVYGAPYPPQHMPVQMPMPMPMPGGQPPAPGIQPQFAPYPPMPAPESVNPPSYDVAVRGAGSGTHNQTAYEKQAPYNPNY